MAKSTNNCKDQWAMFQIIVHDDVRNLGIRDDP